jgi:hypothetical protein
LITPALSHLTAPTVRFGFVDDGFVDWHFDWVGFVNLKMAKQKRMINNYDKLEHGSVIYMNCDVFFHWIWDVTWCRRTQLINNVRS